MLNQPNSVNKQDRNLIFNCSNLLKLFFYVLQATVYKLTCSCGFTYTGQTRRNLLNRIKEHATSIKSEACKRLLQHPTHRIDFNTLTSLGSEDDTARLLISESLFIQEQTPNLNNKSQTSPVIILNT